MSKADYSIQFGQDQKLEDTLWSGLTDSLIKLPMGITAENLAVQYNITRAESDAFSVRSQQNWGKGLCRGHLNEFVSFLDINWNALISVYLSFVHNNAY